MIFEPIAHFAQTVYISQMDRKELPLDPRNVGVPLCVQNDFRAYGTFDANCAPICAKINTISKQTKTSFHLTHMTSKFDLVCPKRFACLLHVWHKPYNYLASRLTLSRNRLNQASIWPTSPWSSIRWPHKDFRGHGKLGANRAPFLCWD
jgi:hypothetical protein